MGKNLMVSMLLDFYGPVLTEKQRDVVELYYNEDLSLAEIAENEGITRQGVRDSIKRAEAQMFELEERLGFARRFREVSEGLELIRAAARDIEIYNDTYCFAREIDERAKRIIEITAKLYE